MKKEFLFLLLLSFGFHTAALAQRRASKKAPPPPRQQEIKIIDPLFEDVLFTTQSLSLEWLNNAKDTVLLPGQMLSSLLDLNAPGLQETAMLKTVFVADTVRIRKGQTDLAYTGTYTTFNVKREKDLVWLTQPKTGKKLRFRVLRKKGDIKVLGMEDLDSRRIYRPVPLSGPPPTMGQ